ncbi:MAG: hypothetical protein EAZ91_16270 [Cytophagales bacterium]|nr:MAG: hypothetical protein EAZ91_16270 [Cytophagales bacterium]
MCISLLYFYAKQSVTEAAYMNIAGFTYKGTQRLTQQDAILINGQLLIEGNLEQTGQTTVSCFVADGVASSTDGAFAAQFVLNAVQSLQWEDWDKAMQQLREVNTRLINENHTKAGDTATTLAGCVFTGTEWLIFSAGDSEVYLIRNNKLMPLVRSHNESPHIIGKRYPGLSAEKIHEIASNTISSYFGGTAPMLKFDVDWKRRLALPAINGIQNEDKLLICSDGLFKSVSQTSLLNTLQIQARLEGVCDKLRRLSELNGAPDNVSAVFVEMTR